MNTEQNKPTVLVTVEGGVVLVITDQPEAVNLVQVDWDNVDSGDRYEIEAAIEDVESLPDGDPFDKAGMLETLHEALDNYVGPATRR